MDLRKLITPIVSALVGAALMWLCARWGICLPGCTP
jgi:hypothetical protein